jgi:hypothetical protein
MRHFCLSRLEILEQSRAISGPESINTLWQVLACCRKVRLNSFDTARQDNGELKLNVMKRTLGLVFPAMLLLSATAFAADVRVMDSGGVEVLVKEIMIDYGGLLGSDKESEGIRVLQGEALVTTKWVDIQSITIIGRDAAAGRMTLEIVLKDNNKKVNATLVRKGRMKLTGKADLGEYSIDLEKIRKITVVSAK